MVFNLQQAKEEIGQYITQNGGRYKDWYVGITNDPKKRLFQQHMVRKEGGEAWKYLQTLSESVARSVEKYFIETLGTDGGPSGGDSTTVYVYAYKKTTDTVEEA